MSGAPVIRTIEPTLYVDLDGTLIKTDLLLESIFMLMKRQPLAVLLMPIWLLRGRSVFKAEIARRVTIDAANLNYDDRLMNRLTADHARGRRIILATASHRRFADAVARHLGFFSGVLATDDTRNLKGARKLEAIKADAGGAPFDYAGNESADLPIWRESRTAIVVDAPGSVLRKVRAFPQVDIFERKTQPYALLVLRAIRLHQWLKNILIFLPVLAAHRIMDMATDFKAAAAFLAYGLCASSIYVLNDLSDLAADRAHPRKRRRPFASGALPLSHGFVLMPVLLSGALAITFAVLPPKFLFVLGIYFISSMAYNFLAKDRVIWDVVILAGLYTLRVLAGAAATAITPSFWLLAFSMFLFLSLALVKRYAEMLTVHKMGKQQAHGRGYVTADMPILQSMGVSSGFLAVLVMALYLNSPEIHAQYGAPTYLWPVCPLILFWISRVWLKTHRGQMHDDPVIFAVKDRLSLVIGGLCAVSLLLAGPH